MTAEQARVLRQLLETQPLAALGTLHDGEPFVSMVPYALLPDGGGLIIHVSALASHTKDMLEHDVVSLLITADRTAGMSPQATARVTLQGKVRPCPADAARYESARRCYLDRFPDSEPMFGFGDFSLFIIAPTAVRVVGGFAQAWSASGAGFVSAMTSRP